MTVGYSSPNVATAILNWFRGTTPTAPTGLYVKMHIGDPGAAGAGNPSVGSTTRVVVTEAAPSGNAIALTGTPPVWTNGGATETLSHVSVWDALTAGNFLFSVALTTPQPWVATNTFTLTTLGVGVSPIAA